MKTFLGCIILLAAVSSYAQGPPPKLSSHKPAGIGQGPQNPVAPPAGGPGSKTIDITTEEKNTILTLQRQVLITQSNAAALQAKADEAQKAKNDTYVQLNNAVDKLRDAHKLEKTAFFDQDNLVFKVPEAPPQKDPPAPQKEEKKP